MPASVAILHHSGYGNLGDDASVLAIIRNIKQRWPGAEIAAFTLNPEATTKAYGVPCHSLTRYTRTMGRTSDNAIVSANTKYRLAGWLGTTRMPLVRIPRSGLFYENCHSWQPHAIFSSGSSSSLLVGAVNLQKEAAGGVSHTHFSRGV
jgi:hypothetical protein